MVRRARVTHEARSRPGAEAILQLASCQDRGQGGLYFNVMNEARANRQAYDAEARRRLRGVELELRD